MNKSEFDIISEKSKIPCNIVDQISTITFGQNCIIIKKKEIFEYKYVNRKYRFPKMIE